MSYVIVDIDGTCSDPTHRLHHIKNSPKNWDAFHDEVGGDAPHEDICEIVWALSTISTIVYMSGRMERCREDTVQWLRKHGFPVGALHMRANGDYRQDYIVKAELAEAAGLFSGNVLCAIDDRQQVVDMWRDCGIRCLQVAKGDF